VREEGRKERKRERKRKRKQARKKKKERKKRLNVCSTNNLRHMSELPTQGRMLTLPEYLCIPGNLT
jgi:hypothetical protein